MDDMRHRAEIRQEGVVLERIKKSRGLGLGLLTIAVVLSLACSPPTLVRAEGQKTSTPLPEELGDVTWRRDFTAATEEAKSSTRPMLVLFDEVPGCQTVLRFGRSVLKHPLIVEAIEAHFVPVAVFNNVSGDDREVLMSFDEPTWNNPIVRIMTTERAELAPRFAGPYDDPGALAANMIEAIRAQGQSPPTYLELLASPKRVEHVTFSMGCFWSGEATYGLLDGVVETRPGFLNGQEVVEVSYDPETLPLTFLIEHGLDNNQAGRIYARDRAALEAARRLVGDRARVPTDGSFRYSRSDDKYHLGRTLWRHVPMTPRQASRANAALARGESPSGFFSPRQQRIFSAISADPSKSWPELIGVDVLHGLEQIAPLLEN